MVNRCPSFTNISLNVAQAYIACIRLRDHDGAHESRINSIDGTVDVAWSQQTIKPTKVKINGFIHKEDGRITLKGFIEDHA